MDKGPVFKAVQGRITREGQLRENSQGGALFLRLSGATDYFFEIAVEVPDGRIDLMKSDDQWDHRIKVNVKLQRRHLLPLSGDCQ
jgi:hypothetical protein